MTYRMQYPCISSHPNSEIIFSSLSLSLEQDDPHVRILDQQDDLVLVSFVDDPPLPQYYHLRGTVVDSSTGKILAKSFPFAKEVTEYTSINPVNCVSRKMPEGTIIRLFNHKGYWYFSTHGRLNGEHSKWGQKTFGTIFDSLWNKSTESLDPDICYIVLISSRYNKYSAAVVKEGLYFVGMYRSSNNTFLIPTEEEAKKVGFTFLPEIKLSLQEETESLEPCFTGISLYTNGNEIKIISREYQRRRELKGSESNNYVSYVSLLRRKSDDLQEFKHYFPGDYSVFDENFSFLVDVLASWWLDFNKGKRVPKRCFFIFCNHTFTEKEIAKQIQLLLYKMSDHEVYSLFVDCFC